MAPDPQFPVPAENQAEVAVDNEEAVEAVEAEEGNTGTKTGTKIEEVLRRSVPRGRKERDNSSFLKGSILLIFHFPCLILITSLSLVLRPSNLTFVYFGIALCTGGAKARRIGVFGSVQQKKD